MRSFVRQFLKIPTRQKLILLVCVVISFIQITLFKKFFPVWEHNVALQLDDIPTSIITNILANVTSLGTILRGVSSKNESYIQESEENNTNSASKNFSNFTLRDDVESTMEWFTPRQRKRDEKGRIYILYWRHNWGLPGWGWKDKKDLGECVITYNRAKLKDAEAVVFHYTALGMERLPWKHYRDPDQYFIFYHHESPSFMYSYEKRSGFPKFDNGFINMTMTYRSDSSIYAPVRGHPPLEDTVKEGKAWVDKMIARKSKISLWVVTNCNVMKGSVMRMEYAENMVKAGLPMDRFGKCYKNSEEYKKLSRDQLLSYKFYIAFENAVHCKDYITEKFWKNAISNGSVPVVWGPSKKDVTRLTPTKSFIHSEDFDSPASLASYLLYLDKNDTAYREYFNWIENPDERTKRLVDEYAHSGKAKLCSLLKAKRRKRTVINSVSDFYRDEQDICFNP